MNCLGINYYLVYKEKKHKYLIFKGYFTVVFFYRALFLNDIDTVEKMAT